LIAAIITTPFKTATPKSAMKPTLEEIGKGIPRGARAMSPPTTANGTPAPISSA